MKKALGLLLTLLLVVGVVVAIVYSVGEQMSGWSKVQIKGLVGSEKLPFFRDPEVIEALSEQGLEVDVEKAGSRQIALRQDLKEYDFAFPAGVPAAEKIRREQNVSKSQSVFFTPMTIASWRPIAEILEQNGIVERRGDLNFIVDMHGLMGLITSEMRWADLNGSEAYPVNKGVLVGSTDIRKSNSAAMYLSLASFVLNGDKIVTTEEEVERLLPQLSALFLRQGYMESSSAGPYDDYLVMGPGKAPLVMIYESQFLHDAAAPDSVIRDDMVLLYPEPTIFTKHILLPFSEGGEKLAEVLTNDPKLQRLAIKHGFRNRDVKAFREFVSENHLRVPETLVKVVEPPSYEILENTIQRIEHQYQQQE